MGISKLIIMPASNHEETDSQLKATTMSYSRLHCSSEMCLKIDDLKLFFEFFILEREGTKTIFSTIRFGKRGLTRVHKPPLSHPGLLKMYIVPRS